MRSSRLAQTLQLQAASDFLLGLLLLSSTWDGLYDALDLPQVKPALLVQLGGVGFLVFAYLTYQAATDPAMSRAAATAATACDALAAVIVGIWLIFEDLPVGDQGTIELAAFAVLGAIGALLIAGQMSSARSGPAEPPG
jgi:hypothetical protein